MDGTHRERVQRRNHMEDVFSEHARKQMLDLKLMLSGWRAPLRESVEKWNVIQYK